jgi:hypothetical protein
LRSTLAGGNQGGELLDALANQRHDAPRYGRVPAVADYQKVERFNIRRECL